MTYEQLLARLDVCMGGRVAEEMTFGDKNVTSGKKQHPTQQTSCLPCCTIRWPLPPPSPARRLCVRACNRACVLPCVHATMCTCCVYVVCTRMQCLLSRCPVCPASPPPAPTPRTHAPARILARNGLQCLAGASSDLDQATRIANAMVTRYGMNSKVTCGASVATHVQRRRSWHSRHAWPAPRPRACNAEARGGGVEARRGVERDRQRDRAGGAAWGPNGAGAGATATVDRAGLDRRGRPIYQRGHQAFGGDRSARDARGAPTQPKRSRRPGEGVCLYALHALHARLFGRVGRVHSQRSAGATSSLSSRAALTGGVRAHAQAAAEAQRRPRDGKLLQPSAVSACVVAGSPTRARSLKHSGRGKAEL